MRSRVMRAPMPALRAGSKSIGTPCRYRRSPTHRANTFHPVATCVFFEKSPGLAYAITLVSAPAVKRALTFLLGLSVALNLAMVGGFVVKHSRTQSPAVAETRDGESALSQFKKKVNDALASGDEARLSAIGFSATDIRDRKAGLTFGSYVEANARREAADPSDQRYWRHRFTSFVDSGVRSRARASEQYAELRFKETLRKLYNDFDPWAPDEATSKWSFLPPEKRARVPELEQRNALERALFEQHLPTIRLSS